MPNIWILSKEAGASYRGCVLKQSQVTRYNILVLIFAMRRVFQPTSNICQLWMGNNKAVLEQTIEGTVLVNELILLIIYSQQRF